MFQDSHDRLIMRENEVKRSCDIGVIFGTPHAVTLQSSVQKIIHRHICQRILFYCKARSVKMACQVMMTLMSCLFKVQRQAKRISEEPMHDARTYSILYSNIFQVKPDKTLVMYEMKIGAGEGKERALAALPLAGSFCPKVSRLE
jgi:hypothetical protein